MKIVLAHGCFDVLHIGHHRYLKAAKAMGDKLIVSCSCDDEIRRIKPPPRPVQNENDRVEQLQDLKFVDEVYLCRTDSGADAIRKFKPDIFVRGIDYKERGLDARELKACSEIGCEIRFTDTEKYSSGDYICFLK